MPAAAHRPPGPAHDGQGAKQHQVGGELRQALEDQGAEAAGADQAAEGDQPDRLHHRHPQPAGEDRQGQRQPDLAGDAAFGHAHGRAAATAAGSAAASPPSSDRHSGSAR